MPTEVFIGLGSNIDPRAHLSEAIAAIRSRFPGTELSPAYWNPSVGFTGEDFLNLVVRLQTDSEPGNLEEMLAALERKAGRERAVSQTIEMGPRTLDLDLLLYGDLIDPALRLPRHDILRYDFVLRPLAELAPELVHPVTGRTMLTEWKAREHEASDMRLEASLMSG